MACTHDIEDVFNTEYKPTNENKRQYLKKNKVLHTGYSFAPYKLIKDIPQLETTKRPMTLRKHGLKLSKINETVPQQK